MWPDTGPVGTEFKITGEGFGVSQEKSFVDIGGEKAVIVEWSDTEITAEIPKGVETGAEDILVNVDGTYSNEFEFEVTVR